MGFYPSKAEPNICMWPNGDAYEYIGIYIDDLAIIARFKFKLKATGPIKFHLVIDFFCDSNGVMCIAPKKYIEKMMALY
jgi:hypothetical protein